MKGIHEPHGEFKKQLLATEEAMRIKKAMSPNQLDTAASWIATVANAERPIMPPVLCGVACQETKCAIDKLQYQVQSLQAQLVRLPENARNAGNGFTRSADPTNRGRTANPTNPRNANPTNQRNGQNFRNGNVRAAWR